MTLGISFAWPNYRNIIFHARQPGCYTSRMRARERDTDEIEVTPAMIGAGADALKYFALPDGDAEAWKKAAQSSFRATIEARYRTRP